MKKNIKIIMKNLKITVYMLMALLFGINTTFGQKPGKKIPVFDVADALDAALSDNFTWNSIAKTVRMIPLKTEGLIGAHSKVQYTRTI